MASTIGGLVIDIGASTASLSGDFARAKQMTEAAVADINVSINKIGNQANLSGVTNQVKSLKDEFASLNKMISSVAGISIGFGAIKEVASLADEYQNVSNRIRTTVSDSAQLASMQQRVFSLAQQTGAALDDTAKMYQRLEQAIQGSGKSQEASQEEAIRLTKILNEEIIVSGASAGEASRSIMDLVHGLSGGVLHAQQLRPIMRQMPDLAHQIAEGLGVSAAQFEAMVHHGLAAADVLRALENQSEKIEARFNSLPPTFARVFQVLHNSVEQFIGQWAQTSVIADGAKQAIQGVANNIAAVAAGAELVGAAMGAWLGGKALASLGLMLTNLKDATLAQGKYVDVQVTATKTTLAAAEAEVSMAAAQKASIGATIAEIDAKMDLMASELNVTRAQAEHIILNNRMSAGQAANMPMMQRIVVLQNEMAVATQRAALAETEEVAATARLAAANVALAGSTQAAAAAQAEATGAMALLGRGASGFLALIGGWPTLVFAAGAAIVYFATRSTDASEAVEALSKQTRALIAEHENFVASLALVNQGQTLHKASLVEIKQLELAQVEAQAKAIESIQTEGTEWVGLMEKAEQLRKEISLLTKSQDELNAAQSQTNADGMMRELLKANNLVMNWRQTIIDTVDSNRSEFDKEAETWKKHAETVGKTNVQIVQMQKSQILANKGMTEGTEAYRIASEELDKVSAEAMKWAKANDSAGASVKNHKKEMQEMSAAEKALGEDVGHLKTLEEQLSSGLAGPYLAALKTHEKGVQMTAKAWSDAVAAGKGTEEFLNELVDAQQALEEQLKDTNEQIKQQHDVMGAGQKELDDYIKVMNLAPDSQAAATEALKKYDELLKSHYDFYGNYIRDTNDLRDALDKQLPVYQANRQAVENLRKVYDANKAAIEQFKSIMMNGLDSVANAIGAFAASGFRKWSDFGKAMVDTAKQMIAQIITEFAKLALIKMVTGQGGDMSSLFGQALTSFAGGSSGGGGGGLMGQFGNLAGSGGNSIMGMFGGQAGTSLAGNAAAGGLDLSASAGQGALSLQGNTAAGGINLSAGAGAPAGPYGGTIGGYSTMGIGGALAGAYYGSTLGSGGVSTGASTVTGAVAGYGLGVGVATALTGGVMAGLAAVPVIGWIALAVLLVDKWSGGGVFGTGYKTKGSTQSLQLGAEGGSVSTTLQQQKTTHIDFFDPIPGPGKLGDKVNRDKNVDSSPEAIKAAAEFFKQITDTMKATAAALGTEVIPVIDASIDTITEYDKKGKIKSTKIMVEAIGRSWEEATSELAVKRIQAEEIIAQVDAIAGGEASRVADQFRDSAETLSQAAQVIVAAEVDMNNAHGLLGEGSKLTDIIEDVKNYQVGEETLLQTYARLATEVEALHNVLDAMHVDIGKTGEDFLALADDIVKAAGGLQNAQTLWNDFYNNFYGMQERGMLQLQAAHKTSDTALQGIGLAPDTTMLQFRDIFENLLPKLTAEEIVQWLKAAEALNAVTVAQAQYTAALAKANADYDDFMLGIKVSAGTLDAFGKSLKDIQKAELGAIDQANALARAAGRQGAAESDLALIHLAAARAAAQAIADLESSAIDLVKQLYGDTTDQLDQLSSASHSASSAISQTADTMQSFADSLLTGNLSPLNDQEKLQEGMRQLMAASAAGNVQEVQRLATQELEIGRRLFASGSDYSSLFAQVQALVGNTHPMATGGGRSGGGSSTDHLSATSSLSDADRLLNAQKLAQMIADVAVATGKSLQEVADSWHVPLDKMAKDLGMSQIDLMAYLKTLEKITTGTDMDAVALAGGGKPKPITADGPTVAETSQIEKLDDINLKLQSILDELKKGTKATSDGTADIADSVDRTNMGLANLNNNLDRNINRLGPILPGRSGRTTEPA